MSDPEKKELGFERLIFFSDAVVAIAITLLALDLKLDVPSDHHITFEDLIAPWEKYLAFILSFINIAGFWRTHHMIFNYFKKIDDRILFFNLLWLLLIAVLPFSTSLISSHFTDTAPIFTYCMNVFMISVCQNFIWDYSALEKHDFIDKSKLPEEALTRMRTMFNLDMVNGLVAIVVSFFSPVTAFILLFFKIPLIFFITFYIAAQRRKDLEKHKHLRK